MGDTKGLPGKAESRQPQYIVGCGETFLLVGQYSLTVWLVGIMAERCERSGQPRETAAVTLWIRIVLSPQSECQRQIATCPPLIIGVT